MTRTAAKATGPRSAEAEVRLPARPERDPDDPIGWKAIDRLIGVSDDEGRPTDGAERHDEYLYGSKRSRLCRSE
jgi:hypothetical protein